MVTCLISNVTEKCVQSAQVTDKQSLVMKYQKGRLQRTGCRRGDVSESILLTSVNGHFTYKRLKNTNTNFQTTIAGFLLNAQLSTRRGPKFCHEHLYFLCGIEWRRQPLYLVTLKSPLYLAVVHLWRMTVIWRWGKLRWNTKQFQKVVMRTKVSVFTAGLGCKDVRICWPVTFLGFVRKEISRIKFWSDSSGFRTQSERTSSILNSRRRCRDLKHAERCSQPGVVVNLSWYCDPKTPIDYVLNNSAGVLM